MPEVESAEASDLDALAALRTDQGWQRSDHLLEAIQRWEHGRIFIVRAGSVDPTSHHPRAVVASVSAIVAGSVGVIGTVIVRADHRRRGLGRLVMTACLRWMRSHGARSVYLDATDDGRPLYFDLGFVGVEQSYWGHAPVEVIRREAERQHDASISARVMPSSELARVAALDRAAFGGDRLGLIAQLLATEATWLYLAIDGTEQPAGYAVVRRLDAPYVGVRLGPLVATGDAAAIALFSAITSDSATWRARADQVDEEQQQLFASIPGMNKRATHLFEALGGALEEDDLIMRLDLSQDSDTWDGTTERALEHAEHPDWLYGWIAPMVF
ncbi:MAG TPA: GNAT family N-acetyltransferase [Ktedonobacterales bacterium]